MKLISVVIPCYNEERYILKLLKKIIKIKKTNRLNLEIIVVDDGSTDNSKREIKKVKTVKLISQKNQGKGLAVQNGIKNANGFYILIQDADLEYNPKDYPKMISKLKNKKAVFGSRYINKNNSIKFKLNKNQEILPFLFNFILMIILEFFFKKTITDLLTGIKFMRRTFSTKLK